MTYVPSCEAGPRDREGRRPRVLARHVPVTRSRGSTPAITATHVVAVPPPCLAPPEPWDGALSLCPHRRGDWARGMGLPVALRAAKRRSGRWSRRTQTAGCVAEDGGFGFGWGRAACARGAPTARPALPILVSFHLPLHWGAGGGARPDSRRRKQRTEAHKAAPGPVTSEGQS